jgi:hypothetical protein
MRNGSKVVAAALVAALGAMASASLTAQAPAARTPMNLEQYDAAMKAVTPAYQSLGRNTMMGNLAAGATDAKALETIFNDVLFFWEARNGAEAIPFAKGVLTALQDYQKAAAANDAMAATAAQRAVTPQCMGCHMLHRERLPDGSSRLK